MMSSQQSMKSVYQPFAQTRATVVNRSSHRPSYGHSSISYSMSSRPHSLSAGTYQSLSSTGVANVRESRQKEKHEMQGLNERLAGYIEQVRFLEARIKMLEEQLNQLSNREKFDLQPIRDMYEGELAQCRKIIDEMSKEKAGVDARIAGLTDEVSRQASVIEIHEKHKLDYIAKINQLTIQIGEYEGELGSLRLRLRNLEDENEKSRELLNKAHEDIKKLRADLDSETAAHIEAANQAQTFEEQCEFLAALLDKIPKERDTSFKIGGFDAQQWWNQQFKGCVRDLQSEYEKVTDHMRQDMEMRMNVQLRQMQSGAVKENLESTHLREEVKKLKGQLSDKTGALNDAEAKIRTLEAELGDTLKQLSEATRDLDEMRVKYQTDVDRLNGELECCLQELQLIMDAKLSLELEIACYRQLLEGEENRAGLKQIVEQAVGVQSSSGQRLSEFITSSSSSSSTIGQSTMVSEASGKMTQSRSSRGPIGFVEAALDGAYITIENNTSGSKAKVQNLSGWTMKKNVPGRGEVSYTFGNVSLRPGEKFRVYAKADRPTPGAQLDFNYAVNEDCYKWPSGTGVTTLLDETNTEKATLRSTISALK